MTNSDKAKTVACKAYQAVANHGKVRSFLLSLLNRSHADARASLTAAPKNAQDVLHWGFIPLIIVLGMRTTPRPTVTQLLSPLS